MLEIRRENLGIFYQIRKQHDLSKCRTALRTTQCSHIPARTIAKTNTSSIGYLTKIQSYLVPKSLSFAQEK